MFVCVIVCALVSVRFCVCVCVCVLPIVYSLWCSVKGSVTTGQDRCVCVCDAVTGDIGARLDALSDRVEGLEEARELTESQL